MRSHKELWLRGVAAVAWIAVMACAAYTLAYFTRGKAWRDYTPLERIAALTPKRASCATPMSGGHETWAIRDTMMIDSFVVSFATWSVSGPPPKQAPCLMQVGDESMRTEIVPGSELEATILACVDRAIRSEDVDWLARRQLMEFRARLARGGPSLAMGVGRSRPRSLP